MLLGVLAAGTDPVLTWVVATVGNTLGAVVNWVIGRSLDGLDAFERLPAPVRPRPETLARARDRFHERGVYVLLLAWLPVGGDALTFVAGLLRTPLVPFLVLVGIGKGARYAVLIAAAVSADFAS